MLPKCAQRPKEQGDLTTQLGSRIKACNPGAPRVSDLSRQLGKRRVVMVKQLS
jgi:hypothetical protein